MASLTITETRVVHGCGTRVWYTGVVHACGARVWYTREPCTSSRKECHSVFHPRASWFSLKQVLLVLPQGIASDVLVTCVFVIMLKQDLRRQW